MLSVPDLPNARLKANVNGHVIRPARGDHVARYQWAAGQLSGHVIDAGCGSGYGSAILADAGCTVTAIDLWEQGLKFGRERWGRPGIRWLNVDLLTGLRIVERGSAVVCFEVIEHLPTPEILLRRAKELAPLLLASVPNEDVWPWSERVAHTHQRHYRRGEFEELLKSCGWEQIEWFGQAGTHSPVEPEVNGRTLVVRAC